MSDASSGGPDETDSPADAGQSGRAPESEVPEPADRDWIVLDGGESSLDSVEASAVAADIGATVVLVAGAQAAGKTTLLVELWAQFLEGPFGGLRFAGSESIDALDARHFAARHSSGNRWAETERTSESDMRFLHYRVSDSDGGHRCLLATDLKGELFDEELVNRGSAVADVVPVAPRADRTIVLLDGERLAGEGEDQIVKRDGRLLLGSLTEEGGIRLDRPLLILATKADLLSTKMRAAATQTLDELVSFARKRGVHDVVSRVVAARPDNNLDPEGLDEVLCWMCETRPGRVVVAERSHLRNGRVFVTGQIGIA